MSDPKWKERLIPEMHRAVSALSSIINEDLMDMLLAKKCLTYATYVEMIENLGRAELDQSKNARRLLMKLERCPPPSFKDFCSVIEKFDGGDKLFEILSPSVNSRVSVHDSARRSGSKSEVSTSQQFARQQQFISASKIPRRKVSSIGQVSLASPMQTSGSSVSVVRPQSSLPNDGCDERTLDASLRMIFVHVDETLKEVFENYRNSVKGLLQSICGVPGKEIEVSFLFIEGMPFSIPSRQKKRVEEGRPDVEISKKCELQIYLPTTNKKRFLAQKKRLLGAIPSLLGYENIEILSGSVSVFLTLRGIDFVQFFSDLHDPRVLLSFIQLDSHAAVQFGNLQPVKIARLFRQSSLLLPVAEALRTMVHIGKETSKQYSGTFCQSRFLSAFASLDFADESLKSELRMKKIKAILEGEGLKLEVYNEVTAAFFRDGEGAERFFCFCSKFNLFFTKERTFDF